MACPRTDSVEYFRRVWTPTLPEAWRDKYREALGSALARCAGLMGVDECWRLCGRSGGIERKWRETPWIPPWFEQEHLTPIRTLVIDLEGRGETSDAEAVRTLLDKLALLAAHVAPKNRPNG
jgi:hypothetical protein